MPQDPVKRTRWQSTISAAAISPANAKIHTEVPSGKHGVDIRRDGFSDDRFVARRPSSRSRPDGGDRSGAVGAVQGPRHPVAATRDGTRSESTMPAAGRADDRLRGRWWNDGGVAEQRQRVGIRRQGRHVASLLRTHDFRADKTRQLGTIVTRRLSSHDRSPDVLGPIVLGIPAPGVPASGIPAVGRIHTPRRIHTLGRRPCRFRRPVHRNRTVHGPRRPGKRGRGSPAGGSAELRGRGTRSGCVTIVRGARLRVRRGVHARSSTIIGERLAVV